ncbi:TPA: hypothetical protein N0F65_006661 [Lagenidium giganteum]|uniref:PB1 domain-containing protein n=1 Tax=Lagenidium giganteum TaxID=4803 RepID=A0AAV2YL67_9STRA|nr:TPA: hypothetical protein N0F65_006661 [Lagenidium giganteum]
MASRQTALKISHNGEVHRVRVDLNAFALGDLEQLFASTFHLTPGSFVIQYQDSEGDCLNVTSEAEYAEACRVFLSADDEVKSLKFFAVARTQAAFQENVAEPIVSAIENLIVSLNSAMEKVKQEEWAMRAQSGVERTGDALNQAARDARDSLEAARQSIQEIPFEQFVRETTDGLKTAAEGISSFAHGVVGKFETMIPNDTKEMIPEESEKKDEEPCVEESDKKEAVESENQVETALPVLTPAPVVVETAPPAPVVVAPPAPVLSESEMRWADQLALIRDFLPDVDVQRAVEALDQANGNVEVVLNSLIG